MNLTLGNPAGLWMLLGIPAILLIHFLRQAPRRVTVSTLFLLQRIDPENTRGRSIDKLRNSLNLWLQILIVLLLTWIMSRPTRVHPESVARAVIVLDSSASMNAFLEDVAPAIEEQVAVLERSAARVEWILMETDIRRGTLYSGPETGLLLEALLQWRPGLGNHDFAPAFSMARSLVPPNSTILFVTDHTTTAPDDVTVLAIGEPLPNCGFIGLRVDRDDAHNLSWNILVRNYGSETQVREWWVEVDSQRGQTNKIELTGGQTRALSGVFPENVNSLELCLEPDAFPTDDRLPAVKPRLKSLRIFVSPDLASEEISRLTRIIEAAHFVERPEGSDVRIIPVADRSGAASGTNAIVFLRGADGESSPLSGEIASTNHPLVADLNWQGLLVSGTPETRTFTDDDEVLLWQGARPLLVLTSGEQGQQLVVHFELQQSNATNLPAMVILFHRFIESVRSNTIGKEIANVETNQLLTVPSRALGPALNLVHIDKTAGGLETKIADPGRFFRAPAQPGFVEVRQGEKVLLHAAVHFADAHEANLSKAASVTPEVAELKSQLQAFQQETYLPIWVLLVLGLLLLNWMR